MNNEQVEEIKRHFGVVAEGLRNEIRQVTEGVANVNEKLERFRQEVQEEFKEVKSMIKFSYAELDQGALRILDWRLRGISDLELSIANL
jgi:hypothetical protein